MSLIYQALKRSEQLQSSTTAPVDRALTRVFAKPRTDSSLKKFTLLGFIVILCGLTLGYGIKYSGGRFLNTDEVSKSNANSFTKPSNHTSIRDIDTLSGAPVVLMDSPLPVATAQPKIFVPASTKNFTQPVPGINSASVSPASVSETVRTVQVRKEISKPQNNTRQELVAASTAPNLMAGYSAVPISDVKLKPSIDLGQLPSANLGELFEKLNRALEKQDRASADEHLRDIQAQLPVGSVARLRSEAWFFMQTGDLEKGAQTYRKILDKLPGDELASLNLAVLERNRQRTSNAVDVLSGSLKLNPNSTALRTALDQMFREITSK